jgi:RNA polymerase sigma factor for flagellar operon FliA
MDWVPRSIRQKASSVDKVVQSLQVKLSRSPEDQEVAKEMGISLEQFHATLNETKSIPVFSLDDLGIAKDSGEQQSLLDCLAGKADADPQTQIRLIELKEIIAKAIDTLPEKERLMVSLYYYEELTMKEIGAVLEITESRVSQIHSKAVYRLRTKLKAIIAEEL